MHAGDILAALLQQPNSFAAQLLDAQGVTRLDVLNYISHGISKVPLPAQAPGPEQRRRAPTRRRPGELVRRRRDPLSTYALNLTERAAQGRPRSADRPHG